MWGALRSSCLGERPGNRCAVRSDDASVKRTIHDLLPALSMLALAALAFVHFRRTSACAPPGTRADSISTLRTKSRWALIEDCSRTARLSFFLLAIDNDPRTLWCMTAVPGSCAL